MKVIHPICAGIDIHKKSFTIAFNVTKKDSTYTVLTPVMQGGFPSCIESAL